MALATMVLLAVSGCSAVTDLLYSRIYNYIVLPAIVAGLLLRMLPVCGGSSQAFIDSLGSMLMVCAIFLPFWMCLPGSIGGGDIKLYLAMAALLERRAFLILLFVSLAGAGGVGVLRKIMSYKAPGHSRVGRIRIGPAVLCAALMYAGGVYG